MLARAQRAVEAVSRAGLALGALATAGIFVLLAVSSLKRYFGGSPVPYTEELAGLLFVVTSIAAVPHAVATGQHVRLLVLWRRLPPLLAGALAVAGDLAGAAVLVVLVRQMVAFAAYSLDVGSRTEISELLLWPWMAVMPLSLAVLALAITLRALGRLAALRSGRIDPLTPGSTPD